MTFNVREHLIRIRNAEYLEVKWRLVWLREDHPDWSLTTTLLSSGDPVVVQATVADEKGNVIAQGLAEYARTGAKFPAIMKAETSAIGRALAHAGFGTQFAGEDVAEVEVVDSPVTVSSPGERPQYGDTHEAQRRRTEGMRRERMAQRLDAAEAVADPVSLTRASLDRAVEDHLSSGDAGLSEAARKAGETAESPPETEAYSRKAAATGVRAAIDACNGDEARIASLYDRIAAIDPRPKRVNAMRLWAAALADVAHGIPALTRYAEMAKRAAGPDAAQPLLDAVELLAAYEVTALPEAAS